MKLLVFAHVPPPHHGQSYAVKLMLDHFGGDRRKGKSRTGGGSPNGFGIECYHVNARYSKTLEDIGEFQGSKPFLILFYCLQAIWCRFRYGVDNFYYVPAPGKSVALYRDWLVMLLCRPFFKKIILHWHAAGLAKWLETAVSIRTRSYTYQRMKNADLSIVLSEFNRRDAEKLTARRIAVVNGGIPDPCPQFEQEILPRRRARRARLAQILSGETTPANGNQATVNVLFIATCSREKGLFDAVKGVALANEKLAAEKSPLRFRLTLIGSFASGTEEKELHELIRRHELQADVACLGFVSAERKAQALADADLFCFPTYYRAENQPANLIEAMAFGLPMVTTRWRSIPGMLPQAGNYPGLVDPKSPEQIADALMRLTTADLTGALREIFLQRFTLEQHLVAMAGALHDVETPGRAALLRET
jgi:glycosyltransferase involved in cell wall biosynthesis